MSNTNEKIQKGVSDFLNDKEEDENTEKVIITNDKSIVERVNKKMIVEDGRELLNG